MFKPEGTECKEEDEMTKKYQVTIVTFSGKQREVFVEAKNKSDARTKAYQDHMANKVKGVMEYK